MTDEISKSNDHYWGLNQTLSIDHLIYCICYINELVQELLNNTFIFYYDAQLDVNVIALDPHFLVINKYFLL